VGSEQDFLPGRERPCRGPQRQTIDCLLKRSSIDIQAGIPWRDLPERFGDWKIVGGHVPSQDRSETFGDW
jgi:hypothetical protein